MILGTGVLLTFPMDESVTPDCFSQGHTILQKLAVYQGSGTNQGWILKNSRIPIEVGGWYCQ
tara:strand:+ start:409 stop:594 length:186 start_codon:yes stop_codon:yes gene_type:complete